MPSGLQQNNRPKPTLLEDSPAGKTLIGFGAGVSGLINEAGKINAQIKERFDLAEAGTAQRAINAANAEREFFAGTPVGQSAAGKVGKFTGEVAPFMVLPGGAVGGVMKKMAVNATAGSVAAALQPTTGETTDEVNDQRVINTLVGTGVGFLLPGVFALTGKTKQGIEKGVQMFTRAGGRKSVIKSVVDANAADTFSDVAARAKRLDTFLTPAEATNMRELVARESSMSLSDDVLKRLDTVLISRDKKLTKSIQEVIEEVAPDDPARAGLIKEGYDALLRTRYSPKMLRSIESDPVLNRQWKSFLRNRDFRPLLDQMPEDSLGRLEKFRGFIRANAQAQRKKGHGDVAKVLDEKATDLTNFLDVAAPDFAVARREAQLNIIKRNMKEGLASIKGSGKIDGDVVPTPVQFYQKFLKSESDFGDLYKQLAIDHPHTAEKLLNLRTVLSGVEGSPLEKVFKVHELFERTRTLGQGAPGIVFVEAQRTLRNNFFNGVIDAVTDPGIGGEVLQQAAEAASSGQQAVAMDLLANFATGSLTKAAASQPDSPKPFGEESTTVESPDDQGNPRVEKRTPSLLLDF